MAAILCDPRDELLQPCYSWNIAARFLRGETDKFLEGFYSYAAGGFKRKNKEPTETRHGVSVLANWLTLFWHQRNMLVYEDGLDEATTLHYLRAVPRAWLEDGKQIVLENAPTYFGKTSLKVKSRLAEGVIEIELAPPKRSAPSRMTLTLRLPSQRKIAGVQIDSKQYTDFSDDAIILPKRKDCMTIAVRVD